MEALAQTLADAKAAGEPVDAKAEAVANGESVEAEIIGDEATGRGLVITAEAETSEVTVQFEGNIPVMKPAPKGKGKKGAVATESADK